ncbi:MAG: hypothetical protein EOO75_02880 [Myxococcales bacterium]|nr:MAG: hypothetical protein EOO75_02880 [Myxococcales bacterium]
MRWRRVLRENGLALVIFSLSAVTLGGQIVTGRVVHNDELAKSGQAALGLGEYLTSGHFVEALFENWESEFLQMGCFVVLTVWLRQKGSPESNPLDEKEEEEPPRPGPRSPWPVKRGGLVLKLYEHSLSLTLFALFAVSFVLHAAGGAREYWREEMRQHGSVPGLVEYMGTAQFWFESFQNWQSEFFSMAMLIVLAIFLREKGSSQSKPVATPHSETGDE